MTYEDCQRAGMTQSETARAVGVTPQAVSLYAKSHGLEFRKGRNRGVPYDGHESMTDAAKAVGVTPQAISQRVKRVVAAGLKPQGDE